MLKRLRERIGTLLTRALLIVPWAILIVLATILLIDPGAIRDFAVSVIEMSLPVRLGLIVALYAAVFASLYALNPRLVKPLLKRFRGVRRDKATKDSAPASTEEKTASDEPKPRFATDLASRKARVKAEKPEPEPVMDVEPTPEVEANDRDEVPEVQAEVEQEQQETPQVKERDMSEDDFYAFLESVSDDSPEEDKK